MVSFTHVLALAAASFAAAGPISQESQSLERRAQDWTCPSFTHVNADYNPLGCCVYGNNAVECCNLPGKLFNGQPYNPQSLSCDSEWFSSLGKWTLLWDCAQGFKSGAACEGVPKMPKVTITWPVEPQSGN
ncbi:hypothetical protein MCOR27_009521 [Pyricularia oryzae]|uniref:Uncharacterized protein n=2 Tax=Pyricularia TaxID=48558 RepID=A0ABQ8N979_PYRGI|nr:hypothetical protein MCOR01_005268 [Pyricularia oryzae]KAI6293354.1 hypothetical protein MCOR33_009219 [Pyricularia grisea]KAI6252901.1 hypothetical protein MCOR19_010507 [Pyricularia oryzae]KAI6266785.1 hypothetical protein MCOR26_010000 [Pyricularia oryzae]KAI6269960.1 hypothetical protein MCOR27_009521 [Pyricularia oryzae]